MKFILIAIVVFFMYLPSAFSEEIGVVKETYCGSGFSEIFVPDNFLDCKFSESCKNHDVCYGRCDKDGDLFGSEYCQKSEKSSERKESKNQCDIKLKDDIKKTNGDKKHCNVFAGVYKFFVKIAGQGPFNGNEIQDLLVRVVESSETQEEAIKKLEVLVNAAEMKKISIESLKLKPNELVIQSTFTKKFDLESKGDVRVTQNKLLDATHIKIITSKEKR